MKENIEVIIAEMKRDFNLSNDGVKIWKTFLSQLLLPAELENQELERKLAMATDAANKGEEGRGLGTALEEAMKENRELREYYEMQLRVKEGQRIELENDSIKTLAQIKTAGEELRQQLCAGIGTHGDKCEKQESCEFLIEAQQALTKWQTLMDAK